MTKRAGFKQQLCFDKENPFDHSREVEAIPAQSSSTDASRQYTRILQSHSPSGGHIILSSLPISRNILNYLIIKQLVFTLCKGSKSVAELTKWPKIEFEN